MTTILTNSRLRALAENKDDPKPDEWAAMARELLNRRTTAGTTIEIVPPDAGIDPRAGDLVEIEWEPGRTKNAKYVRRTRTGTHVVKVERVDARGLPTCEFGSERTIASTAVVRVLARPLP